MTQLRKMKLQNVAGTLINPATSDHQETARENSIIDRDLIEQSIINQQIIIKHLEIITDTIITEREI